MLGRHEHALPTRRGALSYRPEALALSKSFLHAAIAAAASPRSKGMSIS